MEDCLRSNSINFECDDSPTYDSIKANNYQPNGCGTSQAYLFFLFFQLIISIIFLNLFVAVILQSFTSSREEEGIETLRRLIESFKDEWCKFDKEATGYISVSDLPLFIDDLEENSEMIKVGI
jgi:hypothetical protein